MSRSQPLLPLQLLRCVENPHCLLIVTPEGGHLGWVAGDEAPFGAPWTDPVVMEFLDHLQNEKASATMATRFDGTMQQISQGLYKLAQA
ncbi:embryogenesis-associated protein emb8 [Asimina triloba]